MNLNHPSQNLKEKKIHFIGIGGIGMSALARYFYAKGSIISGSDKSMSDLINELKTEGIKNIWVPHSKQKIQEVDPDLAVYSTAVISSNEELSWAKENKKEILHRADLLELATNSKKLISISGTHGKTTTSAMISEMLTGSGFDPSAILGGILVSKNTNVIIGNGDYFVIEADESDKSFLKGNPEIGVITNIEPDHLENYVGGLEEIKKSFLEFAKKLISKKGLVVCLEDKITKDLITKNFDLRNEKLISYGLELSCTVSTKYQNNLKACNIYIKGKHVTSLQLKTPGKHNILNALAAFSVGYLIGINPEKIKQALENYKGVKRRFQILEKTSDITIIDDYAHHPTEIAMTIQAAKELNPKRLIIVLQPHQPIRLRDLWDGFVKVIKEQEDTVFITDTYIARGKKINGISSENLVKEINKPNVSYVPGDIDQITKYIEKFIKPQDLVLIMGAGNITDLGLILSKHHKTLATNFGNN